MTQAITTLQEGCRGLSLLFKLGCDRVLFPAATGIALSLCAWLMAQ
ncbi:hypothetical protein SAMN05444722_0747 [Rhodovulum sp. ES.010]|nr:hypothetical protein [Rhodovulum sp. ES.010]SIO18663.1 hypothetical protein SAMN05444722_0747 [Rhodovulum sp. ES.010]